MRINLHDHDSWMKWHRVNKKNIIWGGKNVFNPIQCQLSSNDSRLIVIARNHLVNFVHINKGRFLILCEGQKDIFMEVWKLVCLYVKMNVSNDGFMVLGVILKFFLLTFALLDWVNLLWVFFLLLDLRWFIKFRFYDWWRKGIQSWVVDWLLIFV